MLVSYRIKAILKVWMLLSVRLNQIAYLLLIVIIINENTKIFMCEWLLSIIFYN